MKCLHCQTDNSETAKYCRICGRQLLHMSICPKCRHANPRGSIFCEECSHNLPEESSTSVPSNLEKQPAADFPGAENKPLAYPGEKPKFSYVYYQDEIYKITIKGNTCDNLWLDGKSESIRVDDFLLAHNNVPLAPEKQKQHQKRHAVLAVGSNGCPGRLAEKFGQKSTAAIPVFRGTLVNTAIVYSRQLAPYGALPATYLYRPGATCSLSVTMLDDDQLAIINESEKVGERYKLIKVPGFFRVEDRDIKNGPMFDNLAAYLDRNILTYKGNPVCLKSFTKDCEGWDSLDERKVLELVFNEANLLKGETIERRHRQLQSDGELWKRLTTFLNSNMNTLCVDEYAELVDPARPSTTCNRVISTDKRPRSKGTYIVRLSPAKSKQLGISYHKYLDKFLDRFLEKYLDVRYGNNTVAARLVIDEKLDKSDMDKGEKLEICNEDKDENLEKSGQDNGVDTIRMDQTLRTAIGLEPSMQGTDKEELLYMPEQDDKLSSKQKKKKGIINFPVIVRRSKFRGPKWYNKLFRQQFLICVVHNSIPADMEKPVVRLSRGVMQTLGIEPGDKVRLINNDRHKTMRCLPLDSNFKLPSNAMKSTFVDWQVDLPENEEFWLPWITMDWQTRLLLDVRPWQPVIVGRDPLDILASEFNQIAFALALPVLGGAIIVDEWEWQLVIILAAFIIILTLLCLRIRKKI